MANEKPILLDLSAVNTIAAGVDTHINDICVTEEEVQQVIDDILGTPGSGGNPGGGSTIEFPITVEQGGTGVTTIEEVRQLITGFSDIFTSETTNGITIGTDNYSGSLNRSAIMIGRNILSTPTSPLETIAIGHNILNTAKAENGSMLIGINIGDGSAVNVYGGVLIGRDIFSSAEKALQYSVGIGNSVFKSRKGGVGNSIAIGEGALQAKNNNTITRPANNVVAIGYDSGYEADISATVAVGYYSGAGKEVITNSVAIGNSAAHNNFVGTSTINQSVFVGQGSGYCRSFTNCVAIGYESMYWLDNAVETVIENSTAIGYNSKVTGNNQVQLGNSSTTTYVYGTVQSRSDERDKANITDLDYDYIRFIDALRPRNFQWDMREDYLPDPEDVEKDENGNIINPVPTLDQIVHDGSHTRTRRHNGFIAQEVKQIMDDMGFDFGGYQDHSVNGGNDVLSLGYEEFIAPMVAYMQDLRKENLAMKEEIATMRDQLNQLLQQK